jgi:hypothetical protein
MASPIEIQRSDEDIEIDRLFHFMVAAETPESRRLWESRFREAINARNAARSDAQLAEIETRKGLR